MKPEPYKIGHRPALDGLRGLAIILVLLNHGEVLGAGAGFIGVNTFFVLSGFLITSLLLEEFNADGTINFKKFYLRRARRLFPALAILLAALIMFAWFGRSAHDPAPMFKEVFYAAFYVMNWAKISGLQPDGWLGHTWSLSIEEQFYLAWPLVLLFMLKRCSTGTILRWIFFAAFISVAGRTLLFAGTDVAADGFQHLKFGTDTRADSLLTGCFTGIALTAGRVPEWLKQSIRRAWVPCVLALVALTAFPCESAGMVYFGWPLASLLAAGVVLAAATSTDGMFMLSNRPLIFTGKISYGLYLWHIPILFVMKNNGLYWQHMAYLIPVIPIVLASYYFVERPILNFRKPRFHPSPHDLKSQMPALPAGL